MLFLQASPDLPSFLGERPVAPMAEDVGITEPLDQLGVSP